MRAKLLCGGWMVCVLSMAVVADDNDLRLVNAAKNQDKAGVRTLLQEGVDVNRPESDGTTALAWAAHRDDLEMADLLIRAGADVNAANDLGATSLWLASANGKVVMVEKLLKAGANPNLPLRLGETPLMAAADAGSVEIVNLLLAAGADVKAKETHGGQTALMWAAAEGHPEVARALIGHGADVQARSKGGFTPLLFVAQQGNLESTRILLAAGADVNETSPDDMSPLLAATASGHDAVAIFLVEKGGNPNAVDYKGFTPLHYAGMRRNMLESVKALLASGANPNARIVKEGAKSELVPIPNMPFLQSPTRIVKAGTKGGTFAIGATPFYLAAQQRNASAMRILAGNGADPNLGTTETVFFLGGSGRRVNYIAGTTPLMAAAGMGKVIDNWNDYFEEQEKQAMEALKAAIESGADVNAINEYGLTALHAAAYIGAESIIQFLAEKGAGLDLMDAHGQTPLSIARHVVTVDLDKRSNFDLEPRRFRVSTADLLVKLGATPLETSGVQVLHELK